MTRKRFLATAASALAAPAIAQRRPRNLVFILIDDHRFDMFGAAGHPFLKTPNLDRLASGGVLLCNAFVTTSLCSPSRASILTGQYVHAHGVTDNVSAFPQGLTTFPQILQKNGYHTALIGKWHMGGESDAPRPGFDRWISFRGQGVYVDPTLNFDGARRQVKGYVTDIITEESLRFVRENAARPFMLYMSHKGVHADFVPAERHRNLYSDVAIPHPPSMANTEENYRGKPDWVRRQRNSWHGVDGMYDKRVDFDQFYCDYCRTLMSVDDSVGALLDELAAKNLLNDTLIIYMGDNGFQFGEHGLIDKRTMYEASIRVPMMAHCPDLFAGNRKLDGMALNIDIAPTLLDAAACRRGAARTVQHAWPLAAAATAGQSAQRLAQRIRLLYEYYWERDFPQTQPSPACARTATASCNTTASGISTSSMIFSATPTK